MAEAGRGMNDICGALSMPPMERDKEQIPAATRHRVWASLTQELKKEVSDWNRRFLPSDGRRIVLDEVPDRKLTLSSRGATVTAAMMLDASEIALTVTQHSDTRGEWHDSVRIQMDQFGHVELQQAGAKTSPGQLAFWLLQRAATP